MFAVPMLAAVGTGIVLFAATRSDADLELDHRQAFIVTAGSWTILPVFAAIPFVLQG